jgi:hypothetical protein
VGERKSDLKKRKSKDPWLAPNHGQHFFKECPFASTRLNEFFVQCIYIVLVSVIYLSAQDLKKNFKKRQRVTNHVVMIV